MYALWYKNRNTKFQGLFFGFSKNASLERVEKVELFAHFVGKPRAFIG